MITEKKGKLNVSPFMICPIAFTNQEATMIIGSTELKKQANAIVRRIVSFAEGYICPLIGVAYWNNNKLIVAHVIFSDMLDSRTRRGGLLVIYGGQIELKNFFYHKNVCERFFDQYHIFISEQFKAEANLEGIDKIIEKYQENIPQEEILDNDNLREFYRQIESKYYLKRKHRLFWKIQTPFQWVKHKIFSVQEIRPFVEIQDTKVFWKELDIHLSKTR